MRMTKWNWDDALAVRFEEGLEQGLETAALNALKKDLPVEMIRDITGLDIQTIKKLSMKN